VEREATMLADDPTVIGFDRSWLRAQIAAQKLLERTFADEADAGAVRFVIHRQSGGMRKLTHLDLTQFTDGKQRFAERRSGDSVEKIALILRRVRRLQQYGSGLRLSQACVVAGGDPRGTETVHVVQANPELDFAFAQDIRVRSASGGILAQEMCKYAVT